MQACLETAFHATSGNDNATGRDLELVAAARAGSNAAFEQLQNRYSRRLYRRIQSITRNHEDAEDALQDTFLRAYLALHSFEGRSQFASWLTRIAINSALMVLRSRRRRAEVSFTPSPESGDPAPTIDVRDTALNPEQLYALRQRSHYALHAISKLKVNLRAPMKTWIERESSMKDVAQTLDLSLAAVKARMHRARKELTHATAFKQRAANAGSISGLSGIKRQYLIPEFQNRGEACPNSD
jgi:RNA polymerase sigma-70 factor (ECF subfamily)